MTDNFTVDPGGRRVPPAAAVAMAMLLVIVAMAGAWLVTRDQDGADTTGPQSTTSAPPASPTDPTTDTTVEIDEDSLESVVAELSSFVEDQRELAFKRTVTVELLDDDEFEARLLDDFEEEDEADIRDTEAIFRALGFLDADDDLLEAVQGALSGGVVGTYDTETNELLVRGADLTPYARLTIVHELTHALDDQHFELFRPALDEADDERGFAFSALVEGNASTVEDTYRESLSGDEQDRIDEEEEALGADSDFSQFPEILLALIGAPYELGPPLVDAIVDEGGQQAVDEALEDPPVSSEQVLDPSLFLGGEDPLAVAEPQADGERFDQGTFGQYLLLLLLTDGGVDTEAARDAAIGWGGDQYVAWSDGDTTCLRVAFVGDTPGDTDEIEAVLTDWAGTIDDAGVTRDDDQAVLTSCG